ncbi:expressed unknown protein [Seminavis robusta]|uniref:RNI-like protein n=1 Tax=Seminavis robusta TaxID=568900 RepID=A0A9N8DFM6_9STRA|nr:expressed unknown protein [Seminavis robusta]|eukprot:Sro102_g051910.1 n/a (626) ;mRNA; r:10762-12639
MSQEKRPFPPDDSAEELEQPEKAEAKRSRVESVVKAANPNNNQIGIEAARETLLKYFRLAESKDTRRGKLFPLGHAMSLPVLRQHPSLATRSFFGKTMLPFFLRAGASNATIQELCAMWKLVNRRYDKEWTRIDQDTKWWRDGFQRQPNLVTDACLFCSNPDTIEFVAKAFPDMANEDGATPLFLFLKRCDRICQGLADQYGCEPPPEDNQAKEIFQMMFECSQPKRMDRWSSTTEIILGRYGEGLSDLLAKTISNAFDVKTLIFQRWDRKAVQRAKFFLPKLTHFDLSGIHNCNEDFRSILGMFCEAKPAMLEILTLPVLFEFINQNGTDLFAKAMQSCPNLESLTLVPFQANLSSTTATDAQALCSLCGDILLCMTMDLAFFQVPLLPLTDGPSLSKLLHDISMNVKSCRLFEYPKYPRRDDSWVPFDIPPDSRLQHLNIQSTLGVQTTRGILRNLCGLTSLAKLELYEGQHAVDANNEIVALLTRNQLESLSMSSCAQVSLRVLVDALKETSSLKNLSLGTTQCGESMKSLAEMMEQNNMSLERVYLGKWCIFDPSYYQIKYWTKLNHYGRGKLSNPKAPLDELIVALETAQEKHFRDPDNLWYGLLRVNPGAWAEAGVFGM